MNMLVFMFRRATCAVLLLFFAGPLLAQSVPPLERRITLRLTNTRLPDVLDAIAQQGGFSFSYNASLIESNRRVDLVVSGKSVREVLYQVFKNTMKFKSKEEYVILVKNKIEEEELPQNLFVSGYVVDAETGERLPQVSIYDRKSLVSTTTNSYGFYRIKIPARQRIDVRILKRQYMPSMMRLELQEDDFRDIPLTPDGNQISISRLRSRGTDSLRVAFDQLPVVQVFVPEEARVHVLNLAGDSLHRAFQLSLFPYIGTNHALSGIVTNNFSLNLVAGYSAGVRRLEIGGVANLVRGKVTGVQIAGFGNWVLDSVSGVQVAGFFNQNFGVARGVQVAGFLNSNLQTVIGPRVAGFANVSLRSAESVQVAGFTNITGSNVRGLQVAGFANLTGGSMNGFQLAGFANLTFQRNRGMVAAGFANVVLGRNDGVEVAGFANVTVGQQRGAQLAGFANITDGTQSGWQIAGFANIAGKVTRGGQLAVFNYADSSGGLPIGIFSYVNHGGYHQVEVSADEQVPFNLAFRTGQRGFYNILMAGVDPWFDRPIWRLGYGVGRSWKLSRKWWLNTELISLSVSQGKFRYGSDHVKAAVGVEYQWGKHGSLSISPTWNYYPHDETNTTEFVADYFNRIPNPWRTHLWWGDPGSVSWIGIQGGFRWRW
ncbi:MAG: hypothetical protein J7576_14225 [Siphonobacter aquaeclarae]|nr:hypothetical protein [Siphonobacter aquaeclarae]